MFQAEKDLGQRFVVDAVLFTNLAEAAASNDLSHTIDYGDVYMDIKERMEGPSSDLIEVCAEP